MRRRVTPFETAVQPLTIAITQRDDTVLVDRREARLLARALIRASLR